MGERRGIRPQAEREEGHRKTSGRQPGVSRDGLGGEVSSLTPGVEDVAAAVLGYPEAGHPANTPRRIQSVLTLQRCRGNAYVQRLAQAGATWTRAAVEDGDHQFSGSADLARGATSTVREPQVRRQIEEGEPPRSKEQFMQETALTRSPLGREQLPPRNRLAGPTAEPRKHIGQRAIQRQGEAPRTGPAPPETVPMGATAVTTKVIVFQVPDTGYIQEMLDYIKNTLQAPVTIVAGIPDMLHELTHWSVGASKTRINRLIIVAHGQRVPSGRTGGGAVKMAPKGQAQAARWVSPAEVSQVAQRPAVRRLFQRIMAPKAITEFWGCNIGAYQTALKAWSGLTGTEFRALGERLETGFESFARRAKRGERGRRVPGHRGRWVEVKHSREIYTTPRRRRSERVFERWALRVYRGLAATREIVETTPPRSREERIRTICDLFDRSGGRIRYLRAHIRRRGRRRERRVRPNPAQMRRWLKLWKRQPAPGQKASP